MSKRPFLTFLVLITLAATVLLRWQHKEIRRLEQIIASRLENQMTNSPATDTPEVAAPLSSPPPELLRLRNEATMLGSELRNSAAPAALSPERSQDEWNEVHSAAPLHEQPGYISMAQLKHSGFATPSDAFQTFQFVLRNQTKEPLTPARMKEIWDLPDDFDDPDARYSVRIGPGIGGEVGYRIVREQPLASNEMKLTIDFETKKGTSTRQDRILVQRNGKWRIEPDGISRQN